MQPGQCNFIRAMKISVVDRQFLKRKSKGEWLELLAGSRVISIRSSDGDDGTFPVPPGVRPNDNLLCLTFDDCTNWDEAWRELEKDPDADGVPTWAEYISLTDPNDANSRFAATIAVAADGTPVIGWNTQTYASRKYTIFGKVNLADSVWLEVDGNSSIYRFFKVNVDVK